LTAEYFLLVQIDADADNRAEAVEFGWARLSWGLFSS
jgi:hypothetical protein